MTSPRWQSVNTGHVKRTPPFPTSGCAVEVPVPLTPHFQHTNRGQCQNTVQKEFVS